MNDLADLYQELIVDHNRRPHNHGELDPADRHADGYNPLCGDKVRIMVNLTDDHTIRDIRFTGSGCAISTASASLMTDAVKGKTIAEAKGIFEQFHDLVTIEDAAAADGSGLGKLQALAGVRKYPARVKCATLAWHTLIAALDQSAEPVSTE